MIPVLYEKDEVLFVSNGLGRLRDCISCTVVEERNSIYECSFEYPVSGAHFDDILIGRIIGVTHDESDDIQPFDIVSSERPIDGIVTFHAVHISYRQTKMVTYGTDIQSLATAFEQFDLVCYPTNPLGQDAGSGNPFTYLTDKESTGYVAAFDGTPRTIRSILGGTEGSILDSYGGEYEWDKWGVHLWSARGVQRDFTIRYGVNMADYKEDSDGSESYNTCIPFWKDSSSGTVIMGGEVQSGYSSIGLGDRCIALDLTDKFETAPSISQLEQMALAYMQSNRTYAATQNISVDFLRIQDETGFDEFDALLQCKLCDTIRVIFPFYDMSANYKIVKTEWDVLMDRYSKMELGTLQTTLSEALGITNGLGGGGSETAADYVVEEGTSGIWIYRKWNSGTAECFGTQSLGSKAITSAYGHGYYASADTINFPSNLFTNTPNIQVTSRDTAGYGTWFNVIINGTSKTAVKGYAWSTTSITTAINVSIHAIGRWK